MIYRGVITAMSNAQKHALLYASLMMTEYNVPSRKH